MSDTTTATVAKKKRRGERLKGCPELSERDQRLIVGFLSAYMTDAQNGYAADQSLANLSGGMPMFEERAKRWRNIISGIEDMLSRVSIRQWWMKGMTPEQIEEMKV